MNKLEKFKGKFFDKELSNELLSKIKGGKYAYGSTLTKCANTGADGRPDCGDEDANDPDCP